MKSRESDREVPNKNRSFGLLGWQDALAIVLAFGVSVTLAMEIKSHKRLFRSGVIAAVDLPVFDLGTVFQAQTISHRFSLLNLSDNALCVVAIKSTCSCTVVGDGLVGQIIAPSGHLMIPVDYSVGEKEGPISSFVSIFVGETNAMNRLFEVQAYMQGIALPEFTVKPDSIDFGSLKPGEQVSRIATFLPGNMKNLQISDPISSQPAFRASVRPQETGSPWNSWTAVITFRAPTDCVRRATLSGVLEFKTSSKRVPSATIYVTARVVPDVEIIPNMIVVPSLGLSAQGQTQFTIRTDRPSHVLNVIRKDLNISSAIQTSSDPTNIGAWDETHYLGIPNTFLRNAIGINIELEVQDGTDRTEARSVFVPIKSLYSTNNEK